MFFEDDRHANIGHSLYIWRCYHLNIAAAPSSAQDLIYNPAVSNGKRIYLSPARHSDTGGRGECLGLSENDIAYWNSRLAAYGNFSSQNVKNLNERGYTVRIGTSTVQGAINNSNAWGAHAHIPLHSNTPSTSCATTAAGSHGTLVIYRTGSTNGQRLATMLNKWLGGGSPGTRDTTCYNPNHPCTRIDLGELRDTAAPAAYLEAEYHTWDTGANWLWTEPWSWRIAAGVDEHFGYPR